LSKANARRFLLRLKQRSRSVLESEVVFVSAVIGRRLSARGFSSVVPVRSLTAIRGCSAANPVPVPGRTSQSARSVPPTAQEATVPPYRSTVPERRSRAAPADEGREMVRSFRSAGIRQSVLAPAKLVALRRIDALQTNARAVDFERVAVNDAHPADEISLGSRHRKQKLRYQLAISCRRFEPKHPSLSSPSIQPSNQQESRNSRGDLPVHRRQA
jgi:hypothetical protein